MIPEHGYDFVQWTPETRGLYESNYLKANSPEGRRGLWIKHNILAPQSKRHPAVLELWCVLFDRDQGPPRTLKQIIPMDRIMTSSTGLRIEGTDILLTATETRTTLHQDDGKEARWELTLESLDDPLFHFPYDRMYTARLPKKKMITPAPRLRFNGTLELDGESISVVDWIGIRGHNWGSEHAHSYAYGNCNLFDDDEGVLDAFTARIRLGPVKSPWLSQAILRHRGVEYAFNELMHAVTRHAVVDFPRWHVAIKSRHGLLAMTWEAVPEECIGLRYLHPDGAVSYCYNTKFARLEARFGTLRLTSDQAELEFLFPRPLPSIPLHGDAELP